MKSTRTILIASIFSIVLVGCSDSKQVDTLIKSGLVYDGTDSPARYLDIAICGDLICSVSVPGAQSYNAKEVIDAKGMIVSPGFIDPHTHSFAELISQDKNHNTNYLFQGVTTVINGNDGGGPTDISQVIASLNANGIGTNTAFYTGHGSIRRAVMGTAKRESTVEEIEQMKALVDKAMRDGALGLSSGLYYVPGSFANTQELVELAKVAAQYGGIYDTHLRDESTFNIGFLPALDEAINIAKEANIHLHVAHIKALGVDVWGQSKLAIDKINKARESNISITADQYPWQASGTNIRSAVVPKWAMADSNDAFLLRLDDPQAASEIKVAIKENIRRRGGPQALLITASENESLVGLNLEALASKRQESPEDTVFYLVRNGRTRVASFNMSKEDIIAFMQQEWVVTSSDGSDGHPRKYGSFPQKYKEYVVDSQVIDLQRFIYSSTGQVASILGIEDRGQLQIGLKADILVFNQDKFQSKANFNEWNLLSSGVEHLFVNGQHAIKDEAYTGVLAGQVLRKEQ